RGGGIDGVQNDTQEMGLDAEEQIARAHEGFLGSFAAAHHEENTVGFDGQDDGVGSGHDGWRIDDDELELGAKLGNGVAELMRRKEVGRIGRQRAGGYGGKIGDGGMLDGDEIKTGNSGEVRAQASILSAAQIEETSDAGLAQVGINQQSAVAKLRESHGKIGGSGGFAFARQGAGDEDDLGRVIGLGKQQGGA